MEVWKNVVGYEGLYQVSDQGRVKSVERLKIDGRPCRERVLKPSKNHTGYYSYELCKDGVGRRLLAHRIVAQAFISNPNNKKEVNHINGIKSDNRAINLEWNTSSENQTHAFRNGLETKATRAVIQYDLNGNFIKEWVSALEAEKHTNAYRSNICHCCKGRLKNTGGYIWKYKEAE